MIRVIGAQGRTGFWEKGQFDKHFMYDIQRKGSTGKDNLKTALQMRIYPIDAHKQGNKSRKIITFSHYLD